MEGNEGELERSCRGWVGYLLGKRGAEWQGS